VRKKKKKKRIYKKSTEGSSEIEMEMRPDDLVEEWVVGDGLWWW
jgi:hypothetical protein